MIQSFYEIQCNSLINNLMAAQGMELHFCINEQFDSPGCYATYCTVTALK